MGGTARLVAWLLAVQLISGCVLTTAALVPARSQVEVLDATHDVEVRSVPDGAVVRGAAGQTITAPGHLKVPYRIERKGRKYRFWPLLLAGVVSIGVFTYLIIETDDKRPWTPGGFVFYASLIDAFSICLIGPGYGIRNMDRHSLAKERPLVVTEELKIEWPGFGPARATVVAPTQPSLTVRRSSLGTFDEALVRWDRATKLVPSTKGLLELAGAYDRLVEQTAHLEHAERAVRLYDQYRGSSDAEPAKSEVARVRAEALRSRYGIRP